MAKLGINTGGLITQNEDKNGYDVLNAGTLGFLFNYFKTRFVLNVVVLNACYSEEQAKEIAKHVQYVIGTTKKIRDKDAKAFSVGFYFSLSQNYDIKNAYESGRMEAVLQNADLPNFVIYENGIKLRI